MKRQPPSLSRRSSARSGGGTRPPSEGGGRRAKPTPGWKARNTLLHFSNPRTPSVPTTLDLRLDEYYAAAALMGLIASQADEPDQVWLRDWAFQLGDLMTEEAQKRRRRRRKG